MKIHLQSKVEDVSEAQFGKHVYVDIPKRWQEARDYCRDKYTDLSPFTTPLDQERLKNATMEMTKLVWIGLYRDNEQMWRWTGEELATNIQTWADGEPKDNEKFVKTWEEALEHCRETHTDLTSLNSETEQRLALSEIQHDHITERVWIGLRDQEHQCPLRKRCGALTKEGHWENWDCEEKVHFICY
uniref:C-type lectin domain-containing protein n=1 Tax=Labrus bergylta TaxID=56723 RepID=A0A3Q3FBW7_9LABR